MAINKELERLRDFPSSASKEFREQLDRANAFGKKFKSPEPSKPKGIDRSTELTPVARPTIVRSLARGE
jgi:phage-related protein